MKVWALLVLLLSGCASAPLLPPLPSVELRGLQFYAQKEYECGPAALAILLRASGVEVVPDELSPQVYVPGREGSLQLELVGAARRHQRLPLKIRGEMPALAAALQAGYPVLVLQNLLFDVWPQWHYAVVVGLDSERDELVLHSGTDAFKRVPAAGFLDSWARGRHWGFVVARPEQVPSFVSARGWLDAASGLEEIGQLETARLAYQAATERWPQEVLAWQAWGNALYASGESRGAVAAYRKAIGIRPLAETYNNLAHALGEAGCVEEGLRQLEAGRVIAAQTVWAETLERTAVELAAMPRRACHY